LQARLKSYRGLKMNNFNKAVLRTLGKDLAQEIHENALAKGFWKDSDNRERDEELLAIKLASVHSEVSEALEVLRERVDNYGREDNVNTNDFGDELADIVIRVLDIGAWTGINVMERVINKHARNVGRPVLHGKRF